MALESFHPSTLVCMRISSRDPCCLRPFCPRSLPSGRELAAIRAVRSHRVRHRKRLPGFRRSVDPQRPAAMFVTTSLSGWSAWMHCSPVASACTVPPFSACWSDWRARCSWSRRAGQRLWRSRSQGVPDAATRLLAWSFGSDSQAAADQAHPVVSGAVQQLATGLVFSFPPSPCARADPLDAAGVCALFYLVVFGFIVGYSAYVYALDHLPVSVVSLYNYINPDRRVVSWLADLLANSLAGAKSSPC